MNTNLEKLKTILVEFMECENDITTEMVVDAHPTGYSKIWITGETAESPVELLLSVCYHQSLLII